MNADDILVLGIVVFIVGNVATEARNRDQFWQESMSHYLVPPVKWWWLQSVSYIVLAVCEWWFAMSFGDAWPGVVMRVASGALALVVASALDFHYTQKKWVETLHITCAAIAFLAPTAYTIGVAGVPAHFILPALSIASYAALQFNRHKDAGPLSEKLFAVLSVCAVLGVL